MNRKEASRKTTRELILKATRNLLAGKGAADCTIRDIAKKAGVSPASVVVHFKSKTALFEEALYADIENALSALISSVPRGSDLPAQLMHLAKGMLLFYDRDRDLYRNLLRHTLFEPESETPKMSGQSERYMQFLAELAEEQKKRGAIRPEVNPGVAAFSIFSLYLGALTVLFRMPEMTVDHIAAGLNAMTDQFVQGLKGRRDERTGT